MSLTEHRARAGTYSIVAREEAGGELGAAVQSHWFSVGPIVPWARPGVGAVATQANAEPSYGPRLLDLLAGGAEPGEALARLLAADRLGESRQVAVVDASGRVAAHTGAQCIPFAGDRQGAGVSCQANLMSGERVWPAMLEAFEQARGELSERLLAALEAGEAEGGDLRGRQSAAILVVPASGEAWQTTVSLRVEDHPAPLEEMRRLLDLDKAYKLAGRADEQAAAGRHEQAAALYQEAFELAPEQDELRFWAALGAAAAGDTGLAVDRIKGLGPRWHELLTRLPPGLHPAAPGLAQALGHRRASAAPPGPRR